MDEVKDRIKKLRAALNMSQEAFGKVIGLTKSNISSLENGAHNVSDRNVLLIVKSFGVSPEWLSSGIGSMFGADGISRAKYENLKGLDAIIVDAYLSLPEEHKNALLQFALTVANKAYSADILPSGVDDTEILRKWAEDVIKRDVIGNDTDSARTVD